MNYLNTFIDTTTMYRLVLYVLTGLVVGALLLSLFGVLSWTLPALLASLATLLVVCFGANFLFSKFLHAPANIESSFITAFILFLIIAPSTELTILAWTLFTGFVAIASKYIFAWHKKHLFNPAALGLVIEGVVGAPLALWWVGSLALLPLVLVASFLVIKKIRRWNLAMTYIAVSTIAVLLVGYNNEVPWNITLWQHFASWPTIFFAGIMLTEPLTMPGTKKLQFLYAGFIGVLSSIPFHVGPLYSSPELALVLGNLLFYSTSLKQRIILTLVKKEMIAKDTYELVFKPRILFRFTAGQYLEWMLPHEHPDLRGVRRYFTIASAPHEDVIRLGVKCVLPSVSTYKEHLINMKEGDVLFAGGLAGDFTLDKKPSQKLLFIAGGIGVTPFRSIIADLLEKNEHHDIVLVYSNKTPEEVAYRDLFKEAEEKIGMKVVHLLGSGALEGAVWERGFLTKEILDTHVPDLTERRVYISGPDAMVDNYSRLLKDSGVSETHITRDYFSGYA